MNKLVFKKPYENHEKIETPTGKPIKNEYGYEIDSYGRKVLVKTGETNLYKEIQMNLESTQIENILQRTAAGDTSMLRPDGIYADLTEMPSNLIEARASIQKLENTWNGLTQELRNKYNNSIEDFINSAGKEEWLKDMGLLPTQATEVKETIKEMETTKAKAPATIDGLTQVKEATANE